MFAVDAAAASAIRSAALDGGELAGLAELRRHFPLIVDGEQARRCLRAIVGWHLPSDALGGSKGET